MAEETKAERRRRERQEQRAVARTRRQVELDYAWVMALIQSDTTGSWSQIFDWIIGKYEENRRRDVPLPSAFTESELEREINRSEWKRGQDSIRAQAEVDRQRFPEDWSRSVGDRRSDIAELAQQYGIQISDEDLDNLALQARLNGWDRDQTRRSLEPFLTATLEGDGDLTGTVGDFETQLLQWSRRNGLEMSRATAAKYISNMTLGRQTLNDVQDEIRRTYLAGMFPAWSEKINQGFDPSVIFEPYRETAANLLEMQDIGFDDPIMKRAAQYVGADGKPMQLPMYQFEKEIRQDPRWQKTNNAHESYARMAQDVLRMFGFR